MADSRRVHRIGCSCIVIALCVLTAGQLRGATSQEQESPTSSTGDLVDSAEYAAGLSAFQARDYETALTAWQELLTANPDTNVVLLRIAEAHRALGNGAAEEAALKRVLASDPANVGVTLTLAQAYLRADRQDDASRLFEEVLANEPDNALLHVGIGDTYLKERRHESALASYNRALAIDPDLAVAQKQAGFAHIQGRDFAAAATAFGKFLEIESVDAADAEIVRRLLEAVEAQLEAAQ